MGSILFNLLMLFIGPVFFIARIAFSLALATLALCGLFALGTFLLGHKLSSLEAAGDCVVWAAALLILQAAIRYAAKRGGMILNRTAMPRP